MKHYSTVYVGKDVHKESFSLWCYTNEKEQAEYSQRVPADYSKVINYVEAMRFHYGDDVLFVCGYEAGCLGYTLYHELTPHNLKCVILAPTTMPVPSGRKKIKTDKRDAALIARCLAHHDYSPVHIPTQKDEQVKEFLRMRDDHKLALKKVKQQINAFCLRHGYHYDGTKSHWTQTHLAWLHTLKVDALYQEILEEYLLTYDYLTEKLARIDQWIEELGQHRTIPGTHLARIRFRQIGQKSSAIHKVFPAVFDQSDETSDCAICAPELYGIALASDERYQEGVSKLCCFMGIKTRTALSVINETGDFKRFPDAEHYAAYLGLVPGENSSGQGQNHLGITKAGNRHLRMLLVEAAQSYTRGQVGDKSKALADRQ